MPAAAAALAAAGFIGGAVPLQADDWTQWRGAGRLGVWHETGIVERFPAGGLKVAWRAPVGAGYAGPAVADGRVFVLDWREDPESRTLDGTERVMALDERTGAVLWTHEWPTSYRMLMVTYAIGPRATPTVDGDRVYVVGATGRLWCLDAATGAVIWERDYVAEYDTSVPTWGRRQRAAGGRRAPHRPRRRRARRAGGRLRQAHRPRALARRRRGRRDGLRPANHLRGRRRAAAHHLAHRRADVARPGDRRRLLERAVGGPLGAERRHAGPRRQLPVRQPVLPGLADDAPAHRPPRRHQAVGGHEPQRAPGRHRGAARPDHHAHRRGRPHLRRRQLRASCAA